VGGFLRMRNSVNAIGESRHAEERLKDASRITHDTDATLVSLSSGFSLKRHGYSAAGWASDQANNSAKDAPAPVPHPLFRLFYQVEIRHRELLQ
jgi:hypothetical protein